jgi:hypothetical protein
MVRSTRSHVGLRGACALVAVAFTSVPAVAAQPAECARARELKAAGQQEAARRMLHACHEQKRAANAAAAPAPAPAPAPAYGPVAGPVAARSSKPTLPADWAASLPTAAGVRGAINGSSTADSALRQQAAFNILRQLISELSGFGEWPPAAVSRMREYDRVSPDRPTLGPANPYEMKLDFQREVLAKLVSPSTARAYEATSWFQDLPEMRQQKAAEQKAEQGRREAMQVEQKAADERSKAAAAAAVEAAAPQWVRSDVSKAQTAHVDLTAFGLQFGRVLNLPKCGDAFDDATFQRMAGARHAACAGVAAPGTLPALEAHHACW